MPPVEKTRMAAPRKLAADVEVATLEREYWVVQAERPLLAREQRVSFSLRDLDSAGPLVYAP